MKTHPAAEIFPLMQGDEFDALVQDIRSHGQQQPIVLHDGMVLDGRNRLRACVALGITPRTIEWDGANDASPTEWVLSQNLHRRHLSASQRAMVATDVLPLLEAEARERQANHGAAPGRPANTSGNSSGSDSGEARDKAAKLVGTSGRYVSDAKRVRDKDPETARKVIEGAMTLPQAKKAVEEAEIDEALRAIPEDDREPLADLVKTAPTTHADKLDMARNLATMPQEDRTRVKVLASSDDEYERRLAGTTAAKKPPPLKDEVALLISAKVELEAWARKMGRIDPTHPAGELFQAWADCLTQLLEEA